jgi:ABC-type transporter Mla subunit MlaD
MQDNISTALEEMRQQLHQEIANTQQNLQGVNGQVSEIQQAILTLQKGQPIPPYKPDVDLGQLQTQLNQLSQEHQEVIKPHLKRLIIAIKQLQTTQTRLIPRPPKPIPREQIQES